MMVDKLDEKILQPRNIKLYPLNSEKKYTQT